MVGTQMLKLYRHLFECFHGQCGIGCFSSSYLVGVWPLHPAGISVTFAYFVKHQSVDNCMRAIAICANAITSLEFATFVALKDTGPYFACAFWLLNRFCWHTLNRDWRFLAWKNPNSNFLVPWGWPWRTLAFLTAGLHPAKALALRSGNCLMPEDRSHRETSPWLQGKVLQSQALYVYCIGNSDWRQPQLELRKVW